MQLLKMCTDKGKSPIWTNMQYILLKEQAKLPNNLWTVGIFVFKK